MTSSKGQPTPGLPYARVAVITRTKNRTLLLRRAIESVIKQRYEDWIHVIVNDGGAMAPLDLLVAEYRPLYRDRVVVIHNQESVGMQEASNIGLDAAHSDFLVVHDDDDSWHPNFLRKVISYFRRHPATMGVVTDSIIIHERVEGDAIRETRRSDYPAPPSVNLFRMAAENQFAPISFVYRRQVHDEIGRFDNRFTVLGDWDFNLRFLVKHDIEVLPEPLAYYHHREAGDNSDYGNSVVAGQSEHVRKLHVFQNTYLRDDIEKGRFGLGSMVNISRALHDQSRHREMLYDLNKRHFWEFGKFLPFVRGVDHMLYTGYSRFFTLRKRFQDYLGPKVRQTFNLVRSARQSLHVQRDPSSAVDVELWITDMLRKTDRKPYVSFDIFDTLLYRIVHLPTDAFSLLEDEACRLCQRTEVFFRDARVRAEHQARLESEITRQTDEVSLDDIYVKFGELLNIADNAILEQLKALELACERQVLVPNPHAKKLFEKIRARGQRIVCVSDMYLPSPLLEELLDRHGMKPDRVIVSCEHAVSKWTGGLYREMLGALSIGPGQVTHIGDNRQSDVAKAHAAGIAAEHFQLPYSTRPYAYQRSRAILGQRMPGGSSLATGLAKREALHAPERTEDFDTTFARKIGYELVGPMLMGFAAWCAQEALKDGKSRLLFLARDGYYVEKVFQKIRDALQLPLEGRYVYASRRLFAIPAITQFDEETLDFILKPTPMMSVRHFLHRMGLEPDEYEHLVQECGLPGLNQTITRYTHTFRSPEIETGLRKLFLRLQNPILKNCSDEREALHAYLKSFKLSSETDSVVDVGWHASNLKALNRLCVDLNGVGGLHGYYFGTWQPAESAMLDGCNLKSYFIHLGEPASRRGLVMECVEIFELLFNAPHPSIIGLTQKNGEWKPEYGESELSERQLEWLRMVHESAGKFVDDFLSLKRSLTVMQSMHDYLVPVFERILRQPTREEAEVLGGFSHRDAFGGETPARFIARLPGLSQQIRDRGSLRASYLNSYWRCGMLAQMNDFQRTRAQT